MSFLHKLGIFWVCTIFVGASFCARADDIFTTREYLDSRRINGAALTNQNMYFYGTGIGIKGASNKTVTISGLPDTAPALANATGLIITVNPETTNEAENIKLNLNNTGAKSIKYNGSVITSVADGAKVWTAGVPSTFVYDGTYWVFLGHGVDNDTTYSAGAGISLDNNQISNNLVGTVINGQDLSPTRPTIYIYAESDSRGTDTGKIFSSFKGEKFEVDSGTVLIIQPSVTHDVNYSLSSLANSDSSSAGAIVGMDGQAFTGAAAERVWNANYPSVFQYKDGKPSTWVYMGSLSDFAKNTVNGRPLNANSTFFGTSETVSTNRIKSVLIDGATSTPTNGQVIVVKPRHTSDPGNVVIRPGESTDLEISLDGGTHSASVFYNGSNVSFASAEAIKIWNSNYPSWFVYDASVPAWDYLGGGAADEDTLANNGAISLQMNGGAIMDNNNSSAFTVNQSNSSTFNFKPFVNGAPLTQNVSPSFYGTGNGTGASKTVSITDIKTLSDGMFIVVKPTGTMEHTDLSSGSYYQLTLTTGAASNNTFAATMYYDGAAVSTKAVADKIWKNGVPSIFVYDISGGTNKWVYVGTDDDTANVPFAANVDGFVKGPAVTTLDLFLTADNSWSNIRVNGAKLSDTSPTFYGTETSTSSTRSKAVTINSITTTPTDGMFIVVKPVSTNPNGSGTNYTLTLTDGALPTAHTTQAPIFYDGAVVNSQAQANKVWKVGVPVIFVYDTAIVSGGAWVYVGIDTKYDVMTGVHTEGNTTVGGATGLVPAPAASDVGKFLSADGANGSWSDIMVNGIKLSGTNKSFYGSETGTDASATTKTVTVDSLPTYPSNQYPPEGLIIAVKPKFTAANNDDELLMSVNDSRALNIMYGTANTHANQSAKKVWQANVPALFVCDYDYVNGYHFWRFLGNGIDTTYKVFTSSGNNPGLVPSATSLSSDHFLSNTGWKPVQSMGPADASNNGTAGIVQATAGSQNKFLTGSATWSYTKVPVTAGGDPNAQSSPATVSTMSSMWIDTSPLSQY